jgi:hypothetical protein
MVVEEMAAESRTTSPPPPPPITREKAGDWLPKTAAVLTFVFVLVTFYTIMARDTSLIWPDIGLAGVIGGLYVRQLFRSGGKKP